ncbi:LysR family transcriptional regulator [Klebsiella pneumoniae]|uniref:LysR family transcriptional regulator n=1 Tax=Klebsiella pneumoniae TaxID=573 RepID=A0A2X3EJB6_KLEPN|nr:LysR family transcriptional regulator [Klebsiella pneumoniae]
MRRKNSTALLDPEGEPRGALRLGVPQSLSEIALPAALSALSQQFPGLSPQITCGWSGQLQRRLENGELDGMLAMGAPPAKLRRGLQRAPAVSPGGGADRRPAFEFARVIPAGVRRTGLDP